MHCYLVAVCHLLVLPLAWAHADVFERYTNPVLSKVPDAAGVKELKRLTSELIAGHDRVLPDSEGALVVVKTADGLNAKLIVQLARQRAGNDTVPILLLERFVTYRAGQERVVQASGQGVHLYGGFLYNLQIGQVVPAKVGGDIRVAIENDQPYLEPVGKARLFLLTKPLPGVEVKKSAKPAVGEVFQPHFFNGTYKLFDDGRRTATITLKVDAAGEVTGEYVSEKTGQKFELVGKVGTVKHQVQFTVKFPQSQQTFQGWMFTRDAAAICGTTRLQEHEFGFYALRADAE